MDCKPLLIMYVVYRLVWLHKKAFSVAACTACNRIACPMGKSDQAVGGGLPPSISPKNKKGMLILLIARVSVKRVCSDLPLVQGDFTSNRRV